jgi:hemoglobin
MTAVDLPDITGHADVERLVTAFYAKARHDPALAHFFAQVDWAHHTPRIVDFWDTLLFGTGTYRDDAMTPHVRLHQRTPLSPAHFERWVALFTGTVDDLFQGPKAEEAKMRARSIAGVMAVRMAQFT